MAPPITLSPACATSPVLPDAGVTSRTSSHRVPSMARPFCPLWLLLQQRNARQECRAGSPPGTGPHCGQGLGCLPPQGLPALSLSPPSPELTSVPMHGPPPEHHRNGYAGTALGMGLLPLRHACQEASALFASSDVLVTTCPPAPERGLGLAGHQWMDAPGFAATDEAPGTVCPSVLMWTSWISRGLGTSWSAERDPTEAVDGSGGTEAETGLFPAPASEKSRRHARKTLHVCGRVAVTFCAARTTCGGDTGTLTCRLCWVDPGLRANSLTPALKRKLRYFSWGYESYTNPS
ncbi:uncharacterized protein LOC113908847 [Zalophus californianus]|uniref:Uncharacterized protein LOC113908847 n=1 Tax=Zalophus californianus TaxID=9704 RepID=A0A6J2B050_ZALCA|nr:uncharacterized protein LOC113908847 [Zalophus californianus]